METKLPALIELRKQAAALSDGEVAIVIKQAIEKGNLGVVDILWNRGLKQDGKYALEDAIKNKSSFFHIATQGRLRMKPDDFNDMVTESLPAFASNKIYTKALLAYGANPQKANRNGEVALEIIVGNGDIELFTEAMEHSDDMLHLTETLDKHSSKPWIGEMVQAYELFDAPPKSDFVFSDDFKAPAL